jgi:tetratricopeptide (TPR) repeat protein
LANHVYALAIQHGYDNHDQFSILEAQWPAIAAALPILVQGDNARLQNLCGAINKFLEFSGRWDEWLSLSQQGEERAMVASDFKNAGWRAFLAGTVYSLRLQSEETVKCADRCELYWQKSRSGAREQAIAVGLRGRGYHLNENYPMAIEAFKKALELDRTLASESEDVVADLIDLGSAENLSGDFASAEREYREALRIAKNVNHQEGISICIGNLASIALGQKDWHKGEILTREALTLAEAARRIELIGNNCHRLAIALEMQERRREALPYAQRAVEIYTKLRKASRSKEVQAILKRCQEDSAS